MNKFRHLPVSYRLWIGIGPPLLAFCALVVRPAAASDWYLGVGAGVSTLKPAPRGDVDAAESARGTYAGFMLGKVLSEKLSAEAHLHLPGQGEVENADVDYVATDVALRYQLTTFPALGALGTEAFVLGGFGSVNRDSEGSLALENDTRFHFSVGAGTQTRFNPSVSLRVQALYIDEDVQVGNISLIWHLGQQAETDTARPEPRKPRASIRGDADGDGVSDAIDQCPDSTDGFPVRNNGCALFNGQLPGLAFVDRSSTLQPGAYAQLDALVDQLLAFPAASIILVSHTDNRGTLREQSILTRKRLRIIASYLSKNGIRGNRLVLRSMGGSQPAFDNTSAEGRARNNRIELFEQKP